MSVSRLAAPAVALAVVLAGCGGVAVTPADSRPDGAAATPAATPQPTPALPTRLSEDRVAAFARERERARTHNARLRRPGNETETGTGRVVAVATDCEARFDRWVAGGYFAVSRCSGDVTAVDGGERVERRFDGPPAVYRVTGDGARRVALDAVDRRTPYRGPAGTATVSRPPTLALANFGSVNASLSVGLYYLEPAAERRTPGAGGSAATPGSDAASGRRVATVERTLAPGEGRRVEGTVARPGAYRVVVRGPGGRVARARLTLGRDPERRPRDVGVYVSPSGGLTVRRVGL